MKERILLIQMARLGDFYQSYPLLTALRSRYDAEITVVCDTAVAPAAALHAHQVVALDFRKLRRRLRDGGHTAGEMLRDPGGELRSLAQQRFDRAFNLNLHPVAAALLQLVQAGEKHGLLPGEDSGTGSAAQLVNYLRSLRGLRAGNGILLPELFLHQLPGLQPVLPRYSLSARPRVILHPGAGSPWRRFSTSFWRDFCRAMPPHTELVITGDASEREWAEIIARESGRSLTILAGKTDLPGFWKLLGGARLLVAGDTGPLQMAAARGIPTLGLFAASAHWAETAPLYPGGAVLAVNRECYPCPEGAPPCGDLRCVREFSPQLAAAVAIRLFKGDRKWLDSCKLLPANAGLRLLKPVYRSGWANYTASCGQDLHPALAWWKLVQQVLYGGLAMTDIPRLPEFLTRFHGEEVFRPLLESLERLSVAFRAALEEIRWSLDGKNLRRRHDRFYATPGYRPESPAPEEQARELVYRFLGQELLAATWNARAAQRVEQHEKVLRDLQDLLRKHLELLVMQAEREKPVESSKV